MEFLHYQAKRVDECTPGPDFNPDRGITVTVSEFAFLLKDLARVSCQSYTLQGERWDLIDNYEGPLCEAIMNSGTVYKLAEDGTKLLKTFLAYNERHSQLAGCLTAN